MEKGIHYALLTALISGFSIFAAKIVITTMDPLVFTTLKNLLVAVVLTIGLAGSPIRKQLSHLTMKQWNHLLLIGLIGGGAPFALFFTGLGMTTAVNGAIIHKTLFIWVGIMAYIYLKERINRWQIAGYLLVTAGALWMGSPRGFSFGTGELMIFAATLLWSVEHMIAKKILSHVPAEIVAWARMTFGVIFLIVLLGIQGKTAIALNLTSPQLMGVLLGGLFLCGYVLSWYKALASAPASMVSLVLASSPVMTSLLTALFITKSTPNMGEIVPMMVLAAGVLIAVMVKQKHKLVAL